MRNRWEGLREPVPAIPLLQGMRPALQTPLPARQAPCASRAKQNRS